MSLPVVPVGQLDVKGAGHALLDSLVAILSTSIELPDIVGLVPGSEPAYDGEQFTVNYIGITRGIDPQAAPQPVQPQAMQQFFQFEVNLLRAIPALQLTNTRAAAIPGIALQSDAFDLLADDAAALWEAIVSIHASFSIVPANVPFTYGPAISLIPQGGLSGNRLPVAWQAS